MPASTALAELQTAGYEMRKSENTPLLGSHGWNYGKGHVYRFHMSELRLTDDVKAAKEYLCDWVKKQYEKNLGFLEYEEGSDYTIKIAYDFLTADDRAEARKRLDDRMY